MKEYSYVKDLTHGKSRTFHNKETYGPHSNILSMSKNLDVCDF